MVSELLGTGKGFELPKDHTTVLCRLPLDENVPLTRIFPVGCRWICWDMARGSNCPKGIRPYCVGFHWLEMFP